MSHQAVYVPLVTPLDASGDVCEHSVASLLDATRDSVTGYIPCLTSGEGWRLTPIQWLDMVHHTLCHAGDRQVVVGIEKPTTGEVLGYARQAEDMGVETIIITTPFGANVGQAEMLEHYRRIHDGTELRIFIYNETALSGNTCDLETLLAVAAMPRVTGIKDSGTELRTTDQIIAFRLCGVVYLQGWEDRLIGEHTADGNVVSLSNLEPAICREAMRARDPALQQRINQLCDTYQLLAEDWYHHVKVELTRRGIIATPRLANP